MYTDIHITITITISQQPAWYFDIFDIFSHCNLSNKKTTLRINDTQILRLHASTIRRVVDSSYQRYAESPTLRINNMQSRRLPASTIHGVSEEKNLKATITISQQPAWYFDTVFFIFFPTVT